MIVGGAMWGAGVGAAIGWVVGNIKDSTNRQPAGVLIYPVAAR
jgi:hypothetical protein